MWWALKPNTLKSETRELPSDHPMSARLVPCKLHSWHKAPIALVSGTFGFLNDKIGSGTKSVTVGANIAQSRWTVGIGCLGMHPPDTFEVERRCGYSSGFCQHIVHQRPLSFAAYHLIGAVDSKRTLRFWGAARGLGSSWIACIQVRSTRHADLAGGPTFSKVPSFACRQNFNRGAQLPASSWLVKRPARPHAPPQLCFFA